MIGSLKESFIISIVFWLIGAGVVLGIVLGFDLVPNVATTTVPAEKWQAVFLENGQVYFGKLDLSAGEYATLTNVYYLKEASELQNSNLNLVKLGGELHGPEDMIYIRRESISFWEHMKPASRVVQTIESAQ
jgi:hypothetical protein